MYEWPEETQPFRHLYLYIVIVMRLRVSNRSAPYISRARARLWVFSAGPIFWQFANLYVKIKLS